MNPDLVDTKIFEYDLKQLEILESDKISLTINLLMLGILIFFFLCIFYIFAPTSSKKVREKELKNKLQYILDKSNRIIEYNYNMDI